mmetsp:Transcript_33214/g.56467  ORF Transcript_33214/g.56467 Transcript_33214/m.56467 type:complete len:116 (+) Transcript_33214:1367-1714(+)
MNRDRLTSTAWTGHIGHCLVNPHNFKVTSANWLRPNERHNKSFTSSFTNNRCAKDVELGLLLDLNQGTLSLHRQGVHISQICEGLQDNYVCVVSIQTGPDYEEDNHVTFVAKMIQ